MRPARYAVRPASTARRIACAIATGSCAAARAVFIRMPSTPCSIVRQASDAVPTPASTTTGNCSRRLMVRTLYGLRSPSPLPIGDASGITAAQPASSSRTATVTISAPDASMARTIVSLSRYLPVPTMRREWKVRPPMVNGVSRSVSTAVAIGSPPSHEMHQLDRVPRSYSDLAQRGPADDGAVVLHHDGARVELERSEQLEQRHAPRYRAALPVQRDIDRVAHCVSSCAILRAVAAGSAASHKARIAATP